MFSGNHAKTIGFLWAMKGIVRSPFLSDRLKNESIFGCFLYPFFSKMINTTKAEIRFINQSLTTGNFSEKMSLRKLTEKENNCTKQYNSSNTPNDNWIRKR